jgi:hypothetical protein
MKLKRIRLFILFILIINTLFSAAQEKQYDRDTYLAEVGITGGGSYYIGDANKQLFYNMQPSYGILLRYVLNNRIAFRAELNSTTIKGDFLYSNSTYKLNNPVYSGDLNAEYNFFDLERNQFNRFSKIYSPYIFLGLGMMNYSYNHKDRYKPHYAFGMGMKLLLTDRLNLNLQWSNKLLLSSQLEGIPALNNPGNLNGSNFLNNDLLSTVTIAVTYSFWTKKCNCLNANAKP